LFRKLPLSTIFSQPKNIEYFILTFSESIWHNTDRQINGRFAAHPFLPHRGISQADQIMLELSKLAFPQLN